MSKTLIVVDMQKDFIDGSLANPLAQAIIKPMCDYIQNFNGNIIFTRDTHAFNYLNTTEGKYLPIEHCIENTAGWCVDERLLKAATTNLDGNSYKYFDKPTFGSLDWWKEEGILGDEIYVIGTCTDICVISNVLILKATYPDAKIYVVESLCAGLTKAKHDAAIEVMKSCQVEVI